MAAPTRTLRSAKREPPQPVATVAPIRRRPAKLQPVAKSTSRSTRSRSQKSDIDATSPRPIGADEMRKLRAQFGLRECRVVLHRLTADTIAQATSTNHNEEDQAGMEVRECHVVLQPLSAESGDAAADPQLLGCTFPLRRCSVFLHRLPELDAIEEPELDCPDPAQYRPSRSPSLVYSPVCPILTQRADGSVSPEPQPQPQPPSPQMVLPKPVTGKRPAYRSPPVAVATAASASSGSPENVYDFLSLSQDDPPAALDPVIERLATENRIDLMARRKDGVAVTKRPKAAAKPKRRAPTKAELQRQLELLSAELQLRKQELHDEKLKQQQKHQRQQERRMAMEMCDVGDVGGAEPEPAPPPVAARAHLMLPPAPPRAGGAGGGKPVVLKSGLRLKPTHQSTPIRPAASLATTAAAIHPAPIASASNAASPWRVTDEYVPSTVYFSVSGRDLLPTYSSDVLVTAARAAEPIAAAAAAEQTLQPSVARKRSAEQAQLAAGQETQKRPKLGAAGSGCSGAQPQSDAAAAAADPEPQKRLNFDESNAPDSFEATPVFLAVPALEPPTPVEITPPFLDSTPPPPLQTTPPIALPPAAVELNSSAVVDSPHLQLSASPLNLSDAENIRPAVGFGSPFGQLRGSAQGKPATRIVLGERPTLASGARNPLAPIAIRSVLLSPQSMHSTSGSSSTSSAEQLRSKSTPFSPTKFMAATRPTRRVLQLHAAASQRAVGVVQPALAAGAAAEKTPSPPQGGWKSAAAAKLVGSGGIGHGDGEGGGGGCENDGSPPAADQSSSSAQPAQLDRSLAECFGFDDDAAEPEPPTNRTAQAGAGAAQFVINPFALRAQMRKHVPAVAERRDSGPRRLVALHAPRAAANLFRDPAVSLAAANEAERRKEAIKVAMQQQRDKSKSTAVAAADDDAAVAGESLQAVAGTSKATTTADAAARASVAVPRYSEFERDVLRGGRKADAQPVDPDPLFETRWPEQNKPNRKSYSRPQRKRPVESSFTDSDESAGDGDDDDDDEDAANGGGKRRRKRNQKERRKAAQAAASAAELARFANEFNSMCEEVDQFDVVMEKSL